MPQNQGFVKFDDRVNRSFSLLVEIGIPRYSMGRLPCRTSRICEIWLLTVTPLPKNSFIFELLTVISAWISNLSKKFAIYFELCFLALEKIRRSSPKIKWVKVGSILYDGKRLPCRNSLSRLIDKDSMAITNKFGQSASPCLIPLLLAIKPWGEPLMVIE